MQLSFPLVSLFRFLHEPDAYTEPISIDQSLSSNHVDDQQLHFVLDQAQSPSNPVVDNQENFHPRTPAMSLAQAETRKTMCRSPKQQNLIPFHDQNLISANNVDKTPLHPPKPIEQLSTPVTVHAVPVSSYTEKV